MSITVAGTKAQRRTIEGWIKRLCPTYRVNPNTGAVEFIIPMQPVNSPACRCIGFLVNHPTRTVTITPLPGPTSPVPGAGGATVGDSGGGATATGPGGQQQPLPPGVQGPPAPGPGDDSNIFIDVSNNDGHGYHGYDKNGDKISAPMHIILGHELCTGHAYHNARGTSGLTSPEREQQATDHENDIRTGETDEDGNPKYSPRSGHGAGKNAPGDPPPPDRRD